MEVKKHWESIYTSKQPTEVSWHKAHLDPSLRIISQLNLTPKSATIDVGAGASTLVDDLLEKGFQDITALDISASALDVSKKRLGKKAGQVNWIEADITNAKLPPNHYELWHDRAVFHFLTETQDRHKYAALCKASLKVGGNLIIATFNLGGPLKCSGLEIVRYSPESLLAELGSGFKLMNSFNEAHKTPFGTVQNFVYCLFQKTA